MASCYGTSQSEMTNAYSTPVPAAEPDKTSRLQALFSGITGVVGSIGDVYTKLRYKPEQAGTHMREPRTKTLVDPSYVNRAKTFLSGIDSQTMIIIIGVGLAAILLVRFAKR
jgi:hypothetical protein